MNASSFRRQKELKQMSVHTPENNSTNFLSYKMRAKQFKESRSYLRFVFVCIVMVKLVRVGMLMLSPQMFMLATCDDYCATIAVIVVTFTGFFIADAFAIPSSKEM
uniref:Uncharacterized protein n=1 Tax=Glossina pallidipes TaxID=7398 RepID=A0A1B0A8G0_GLOPL